MVLFFTHIPFVVNHTISATPPERLQQYKGLNNIVVPKVVSILLPAAKALPGAIWPFKLSPSLSTYNAEFITLKV